jgi:hypothetical protein
MEWPPEFILTRLQPVGAPRASAPGAACRSARAGPAIQSVLVRQRSEARRLTSPPLYAWAFNVVLAAAAQSIAAERPPQTSPDTTVLEKGIKEKLESANPGARLPSPSKASPSRSHLKLVPARSFRHGARPQPKSSSNLEALSSRSHIKSKSVRSFGHRTHHESRSSSKSKALPCGSHSRTHDRQRSHRHRFSRAGEQPVEVPIVIVPMQEVVMPLVIVPIAPDW